MFMLRREQESEGEEHLKIQNLSLRST